MPKQKHLADLFSNSTSIYDQKKREKKHRAANIAIGVFISLICIFVALHSATFAMHNPETKPVNALVFGVYHAIVHPLDIGFTFSGTYFKAMIPTVVVWGVTLFLLWVDDVRHRHFAPDLACGSAEWNKDLKTYNQKYTDPIGDASNGGPENMIFTKDVFLHLDGFKTKLNNNTLVVGGSGSGKSRYYVKPNILQANSNFVVTDPSGELLTSTGTFLRDHEKYNIKVFNLVEFTKSNCYNPFHYIRDDAGVLSMIRCLIKNTTPPEKHGGDPFWEKSEEALLQAICLYLWHHEPQNANFSRVMEMLRMAQVDESGQNKEADKLDKLFEEVKKRNPADLAVQQYAIFKQGAGKTMKSILISCSVRLSAFNLPQIKNLTDTDDIHLEELGGPIIDPSPDDGPDVHYVNPKQALFVIIPSADSTYNFLAAMLYSQLFETLYNIAETKRKTRRLYRNVRFLLDEFANIANLPEFDKKLATMRKYGIACSVILQNISQLKGMYEKEWQGIIGNCDSFLFLGGFDEETTKYVSDLLGDSTIVVKDRSLSNGKSSSDSQSYKTQSRKLLNPDEVARIPFNQCILVIRGLNPFLGLKYDYTDHPNYVFTGDCDSSKEFINTINNDKRAQAEAKDKVANEENTQIPYSEPSIEKILTDNHIETEDQLIMALKKQTDNYVPTQAITLTSWEDISLPNNSNSSNETLEMEILESNE